MSLLHPQLAAFAAVIEEQSFDGAARRLSVTPSAISQRVKALEDRLGQVLIVRQLPCRPTAAGQKLLCKVKPMLALEAEAFADFDPSAREATPPRLTIAVNDDSLETWLLPALAQLHQDYGYLFDIVVDDQDHSLNLLRDGLVVGAVTSEARVMQGCNIHLLGTMRYQAIASPEFQQRYFAEGLNEQSLTRAPMLVFSRKDELQNRFIQQVVGKSLLPPIHYLPTSKGFVEAATLGMGWCMVPESMIQPLLPTPHLVMLHPSITVDVPLYWQHASVQSDTFNRLTSVLRQVASRSLRQAS